MPTVAAIAASMTMGGYVDGAGEEILVERLACKIDAIRRDKLESSNAGL